MSAYAEWWDWMGINVAKANRDVATRWHFIGSLPLVVVVKSMRVVFDGETLRFERAFELRGKYDRSVKP